MSSFIRRLSERGWNVTAGAASTILVGCIGFLLGSYYGLLIERQNAGLSPVPSLLEGLQPWQFLVILATLFLLVVLAIAASVWRISSQNLVLRVRLEQAAQIKRDVENKNRQLTRQVAERKRAEQALRESEEKYRMVVDNASDAIFFVQDGLIKFPNPRTFAITGYSSEELSVLPVEELIHPEERSLVLERHRSRLRGEGVPSSYALRILNKDGETHWVEISSILSNWEGKPATLSFVRDISVQKKLEAQLLHAHKMEAVGTLAGGIAHDFNNLLQAAQGYAELGLMIVKPGNIGHRELGEILQIAKRGGELSRQLLTFSRKIESKLRPTDLNQQVRQIMRLLERTIPKLISIELDLAEDLKAVNADPSQIEQVLMNLTINAKDAMPKGGKLLVTTRNVYLSQGDGELHMDFVPGRYLHMKVKDTGEGMDKKTLDRMFEPFYTTKGIGRGTGLGLSMVYGIIKNHQGFINCSSELGKGTTFEIYLPALEFQESKSNEVVDKIQLRGTETLLVIDDEDSIRNLVQEIFSNFGYTILKAANLKQAMEILGEHPVDLVLLDLMMPEVSGTECLKELLRNDPSLKVVIASGYVPDSSTRKTLEKYARAFVNKPYNAKQMLQVIRQVLDRECLQVENGISSMPG